MPVTLLNEVNTDSTSDPWKSDGACKSIIIDAVSFGSGNVTIEVRRPNGQWVIPKLIDGSPAVFGENTIEKLDYLGFGLGRIDDFNNELIELERSLQTEYTQDTPKISDELTEWLYSS